MEKGKEMHSWAQELFPITRSITGEGVRQTLGFLKTKIPELNILSVKTGEKAFDWEVPEEWVIREAYIEDTNGNKIIDFNKNNLHVVGYSTAINKVISRAELDSHLYSLEEQPTAIPYVTSYYKKQWGFCLSHDDRLKLNDDEYKVVIDSEHINGILNYAELLIPGRSEKEIFLSTYVCHPSMANNELSGPVVTTALAQWISELENREYSYRIVFIPETIGSLVYLSKNLKNLKENVVAGFNINCVGDERCYSYLPSKAGDTLSDEAAKHALSNIDPEFKQYTWLNRGSDERQYCSPGVNLPIASIMRSKFGEYPEYHTSLDDLNLVTAEGLEGGYQVIKSAIDIVENNSYPKATIFGEPRLGNKGLYPNTGIKGKKESIPDLKPMMHLISYSDGTKSILEIAELIDYPFDKCKKIVDLLVDKNVLTTTKTAKN